MKKILMTTFFMTLAATNLIVTSAQLSKTTEASTQTSAVPITQTIEEIIRSASLKDLKLVLTQIQTAVANKINQSTPQILSFQEQQQQLQKPPQTLDQQKQTLEYLTEDLKHVERRLTAEVNVLKEDLKIPETDRIRTKIEAFQQQSPNASNNLHEAQRIADEEQIKTQKLEQAETTLKRLSELLQEHQQLSKSGFTPLNNELLKIYQWYYQKPPQ